MIPNSADIEAEALLSALKRMLRERRISYQAIADSMQVSLPTVKRMLNKPNLPLDRLFGICRIAQIDPVDVFSLAAKSLPAHTTITAAQDALFFEKPEFLTYFSKLTHEGMSPDEIAEESDLTSAETHTFLAGLEKVGLIERETGNKVRILVKPPFGFGPGSKVLRAQQAEFMRHTVAQVLAGKRDKNVFAILKPLELPADLYLEMVSELIALVDKYAYHSEHPGNRHAPGREDWCLTIAAGPGNPNQQVPLKRE